MGNIGWTGIIIIAILVVILFGKGKISSIMGDLAKGIKSFKKGMTNLLEMITPTIIQITRILKISNLICLKLVG
jgi:TatA/E family protein of Tat protein translocase